MKIIKLCILISSMVSIFYSDTIAENILDSVEVPDTIREKAFVTSAVHLKTLKSEAGLGDYLKVKVTNLDVLLQMANEREEKIVLFFNEVPMHGIYADFTSTRDSSLIFQLTRDTLSMKAWNVFYQGPSLEYKRQVKVSVGFENNGSLDSDVKKFSIILVKRHLLIAVSISIVVLIVLFILLVRRTGIIRDDNSLMGHEAPYSLSRTQLAFWTFIIVFSFLFIYIVTGEIPPITGSTLVLLTSSMATAAGAKLISSSKNPENKLGTDKSEGFFNDIISDYHSVSIHRFQMVVWTFILGILFLRSVLKSLSMPQFDESMLLLMGVSSGTYLGLKIPEKKPIVNSTEDNASNEKDVDEAIHETPAVG